MSISNSAISRVTGIDISPKNFNVGGTSYLPQRLAIVGQGNSSLDYDTGKVLITGAGEAAEKFGYGSPIHLASRMIFPDNNDCIGAIPVTVYPLKEKKDATASKASIIAKGTAEEQTAAKLYIGGIEVSFLVEKGMDENTVLTKIKHAIDGVLQMPALTEEIKENVDGTSEDPSKKNTSKKELPLMAKWKGESGNMISLDINEMKVPGITFEVKNFDGGALNPDVTEALEKISDIWETFILDLNNYDDLSTLAKYREWGEGRWSNMVKKPCLVAHGCTDDFAKRTAVTDDPAQIQDRVNFLIVSVGSRELPFCVAARGLSKDIIPTANDNPPQNYKGHLTLLKAGRDEEQENYNVRNNSLQMGSSTNIKVGDIAELNDIVTFYHPKNDTIGVYKYVCDLVKIMNVLYNCEIIFKSDEWKGAPLLPDETPSSNPAVKKPKDAKTALRNLADSLADKAIISDNDFTKANITASIDSQNPKRLNWTFPVKISGNTEVISGDIYVGVYLEK